ncbi:MAG TPA: divalent-cation tolerance protein CutA [Gammaproteobacteria bacterium]|nr:divalent-cation tolerance protein CutA [Gammaproteobacteria bacterium]
MREIAILYTTLGSLQDAEKLAKQMVTEKYAACVNIIPNAISIYAWEGNIEQSSECLMIFKTDVSKVNDLQEYISKEHPYTVPAILQGNIKTSSNFYQFVNQYSLTLE